MNRYLRALFFIIFFVLPPLGYTQEPISWNEIISGAFEPRRDPVTHQIYLVHINRLKKANKSMESVILKDVFKMPSGEKPDTKNEPEYRLIINSFPYWLEPNIAHLLVFSNHSNWDKNELIERTKSTLAKQLPKLFQSCCYEYAIHINIPVFRSVRGLAHSHVFIRNTAQSEQIYELVRNVPLSRADMAPPGWKSKLNLSH